MALRLISSRFMKSKSIRLYSNKTAEDIQSLVEKFAVTDDGKTIVAWHPNVAFPYEFSKPIPNPEQVQNSSLLKEKSLENAMKAFKQKHPEVARQELMNITYTSKHRWFPRARDKKAKKTPMERPYL